MLTKRAFRRGAIVALVSLATLTVGSASAVPAPSTTYAPTEAELALVAAANTAGVALDAAYIAGDYAAAVTQIAIIEDAAAQLAQGVADAQPDKTAATTALSLANLALAAAQGPWDGIQTLYNNRNATQAAANLATLDVLAILDAYNAAQATLNATPAMTFTYFCMTTCPPDAPMVMPVPNPAWDIALQAMLAAQSAHLSAVANKAGLDASVVAYDQQLADAGFDAISDAYYAALYNAAEAQDALDLATSKVNVRQGLLDQIADARSTAAARSLDMDELEQINAALVWTVTASTEDAEPGESVQLTFTTTNPEFYHLSDAAVRVISPNGVSLTCDIEDDVLEAGESATCTATYVVTAADATLGYVDFRVELSGYLPLGPGNPRAASVTRTPVTLIQTLRVHVAAGSAAAGGGTLADSGASGGAQAGLAAVALALSTVGALVLVGRRRQPQD